MSSFQVLLVPGSKALEEWLRLRSEYPASGLYPVMLGSDADIRMIREGAENPKDPQSIINACVGIDPFAWFSSRRRELIEDSGEEIDEGQMPVGPVDSGVISAHLDVLSGKPFSQIGIALLPVDAPWEVFAHLNWGAWNDCPSPEEHCSLHRYWQVRYGSEVVSVTHDVVECKVSRPATTRAAALELAREQHL